MTVMFTQRPVTPSSSYNLKDELSQMNTRSAVGVKMKLVLTMFEGSGAALSALPGG